MRAAAGTTAADGRGRNSPYTAALLTHLETPLEIGLLFRRVRAQVLAATNGAQRPREYQSLEGEEFRIELSGQEATRGCDSTHGAISPGGREPQRRIARRDAGDRAGVAGEVDAEAVSGPSLEPNRNAAEGGQSEGRHPGQVKR